MKENKLNNLCVSLSLSLRCGVFHSNDKITEAEIDMKPHFIGVNI